MKIEIDSLSITEKLALVDRIWSSLESNPDSAPSIDWHKALLEERVRRLESGDETVSPLADVKERLKVRSN